MKRRRHGFNVCTAALLLLNVRKRSSAASAATNGFFCPQGSLMAMPQHDKSNKSSYRPASLDAANVIVQPVQGSWWMHWPSGWARRAAALTGHSSGADSTGAGWTKLIKDKASKISRVRGTNKAWVWA